LHNNHTTAAVRWFLGRSGSGFSPALRHQARNLPKQPKTRRLNKSFLTWQRFARRSPTISRTVCQVGEDDGYVEVYPIH